MITVPETTGGWKAETGRGTEAEEKDEWEESKAGSWETLQGQTLQQHNTILLLGQDFQSCKSERIQ